jgi:Family of unknown function (DUF6338)
MPEAFEAAAAFFAGVGGTTLFFAPGVVFVQAFSRGIKWARIGRDVFAVVSGLGAVLIHLIFLAWTAPLVDRILDDFKTDSRLQGDTLFEFSLWVMVVLFIGPTALGLVLGRLAEARRPTWFRSALNRLALSPVSRTDEAWDWKFRSLGREQGIWLRVWLKADEDPRVYVGRFGANSFAGSSQEPDLYLEHVWPTDEHGRPLSPPISSPYPGVQIEVADGVLISGKHIRAIEFIGRT